MKSEKEEKTSTFILSDPLYTSPTNECFTFTLEYMVVKNTDLCMIQRELGRVRKAMKHLQQAEDAGQTE